eukprot:8305659-Pyramimonas_sp.AAC.1
MTEEDERQQELQRKKSGRLSTSASRALQRSDSSFKGMLNQDSSDDEPRTEAYEVYMVECNKMRMNPLASITDMLKRCVPHDMSSVFVQLR